MTSLTIISFTLLAVSLIMAGAMAVAWASFGRPRHALSWSIAYILYSGQVLCSSIGILLPATQPVVWRLELLFIVVPAVLVAAGARQRAGLPSLLRPLGIIAGLVFVVVEAIDLLPGDTRILASAGSLFTACMLILTIGAIRPRGRAADPAEWAMLGVLAVFTLFEMLLVATQLASLRDPEMKVVWNGLYLIGIMPVFIATGVAAITLLASDLAAQLRTLAANDPLTGVLNRRGFHEAALRAVANGRRQRQSISVAIADIDHFKSINDRHGHTVGDRTLGFVCGRLTKGVRGGDLVGRIGGEEFALLLINSSAEQAAEAMERIRADIAVGYSEDGAPAPVTSSFGVASVLLGGSSPEQMLAEAMDRADKALYRSKIEGRNRTTLAD
ncbi:GGDEF domain-containing protein [Sphingomonas sp. CGMCC 1.13654]|uniref:diguanylate cyclase n=1 Tax=Sphingomonas chungangi TaxID=2683589 RepID=A0A838L3M5_9SPHN|nr:GGDEF domain-containing protein [Sphingomonas chungangi]MBA2933285.1 GGDEF domain-containing protein [Sphingomonas chungangi]MVW57955.1 diguanylate cyclase [Sphingomonas chungangi]